MGGRKRNGLSAGGRTARRTERHRADGRRGRLEQSTAVATRATRPRDQHATTERPPPANHTPRHTPKHTPDIRPPARPPALSAHSSPGVPEYAQHVAEALRRFRRCPRWPHRLLSRVCCLPGVRSAQHSSINPLAAPSRPPYDTRDSILATPARVSETRVLPLRNSQRPSASARRRPSRCRALRIATPTSRPLVHCHGPSLPQLRASQPPTAHTAHGIHVHRRTTTHATRGPGDPPRVADGLLCMDLRPSAGAV